MMLLPSHPASIPWDLNQWTYLVSVRPVCVLCVCICVVERGQKAQCPADWFHLMTMGLKGVFNAAWGDILPLHLFVPLLAQRITSDLLSPQTSTSLSPS